MDATDGNLRDRIVSALKSVRDPELPINIYDLGLIYELDISDGTVNVRMTLTTPNCPMADMLVTQARQAIEAIDEVQRAEVELIWEPIWDPSRISEEAQLELEFMGLDHIFHRPSESPPGPQAKPADLTVKRTDPPTSR